MICTVVDRPQLFDRLVDRLAPQILGKDIEVLVYWNNYERQLGEVRQKAIEEAKGEYVNFIDDDDLVTEDYVDSIYPHLHDVDYIGFMVDFFVNGKHNGRPVYHTLKSVDWWDDPNGFYRRVTHVNPVRRELAVKYAGYDQSDYKQGIAEDELYRLNMDDKVKTEYYVAKPIHLYYQTDNHAWSKFIPEDGIYKRPKLPPQFRFHPLSTKG